MAMFYFARQRKWMLDEFRRVVNHLGQQYAQDGFVERTPIDMSADDVKVRPIASGGQAC